MSPWAIILLTLKHAHGRVCQEWGELCEKRTASITKSPQTIMKHREEFFPHSFNRKGAFSSSSSARSPATCKDLNGCNKKENSGSTSCTFVVVLPSWCLWTTTVVEVGVPLQLRHCPAGLGSVVPVLFPSSILAADSV